MSVAIALTLLAEAAAVCPPGAHRLGGDAVLVRPVGTSGPVPFERLGPVESVVSRPTEIQQAEAEKEADEADGEPPRDACEEAPVSVA